MNYINAIVYVSPIIDKQNNEYIIDWVEMVKTKLVVREQAFETLIQADDAIKALKQVRKDI